MKKIVDLPLRYKFLLLIAGLLSAAILFYLLLAIRLFDEDKTAFVYEGQGALAGTLSDQANRDISSSIKSLQMLTVLYGQPGQTETQKNDIISSLLKAEENLISFRLYEDNTQLSSTTNDALLKPYQLGAAFTDEIYKRQPIDFASLARDQTLVKNVTQAEGPPAIRVSVLLPNKSTRGRTLSAHIIVGVSEQMKTLGRSEDTDAFLIDKYGAVLIHRDQAQMLNMNSLAQDPAVQDVLKAQSRLGSKEYKNASGETSIVSYSKVGIAGISVITKINKDKAFIATTRLKEKSIYVAMLILAASFMISVLFTKQLTIALQKLSEAANRIAKGDFDVTVAVRGQDEVGTLSATFNYMAKRIIALLKETAVKARMEKELETAHLVQENFFPVETLSYGPAEIAAFFKSASECGGDWWGHIEYQEKKLYILIGDATGHGVPAALITAAAHSCCATIKQIVSQNDLYLGPGKVMETLNNTIFAAARGQVKMTFFVAEIDLDTGQMRYANASHELPLVSRASASSLDEPRSKENLDTLMSVNGPILGEKADVHYSEGEYQLTRGDVILWYTDGLTECRNREDEEFGEQRLVRNFTKVSHAGPEAIREELLGKLSQFQKDRILDDDLTLVILRYLPLAQTIPLAG